MNFLKQKGTLEQFFSEELGKGAVATVCGGNEMSVRGPHTDQV